MVGGQVKDKEDMEVVVAVDDNIMAVAAAVVRQFNILLELI